MSDKRPIDPRNHTKACEACGSTIHRRVKTTDKIWQRKRACSVRCSAILGSKPVTDFFGMLVPNGECLEWPLWRDHNGYGHCWQKQFPCSWTHRIAYHLANGPIPQGMSVLHRCDNPSCCNPDHLFLGTQADNMADMAAKGRGKKEASFRGSAHPRSKINEDIAKAIKASSLQGRQLAKMYGISDAIVSDVRRGRTWGHVA